MPPPAACPVAPGCSSHPAPTPDSRGKHPAFGDRAAYQNAVAVRLSRLTRIQRRFDPLPVDDAVAESYGQLAAHVAALGRSPRARSLDLLIAATAHAHDATLYTRNEEDFDGLEGFIRVARA